MHKDTVAFAELGSIEYGKAWDLQERMLRSKTERKRAAFLSGSAGLPSEPGTHHLLFCEHPPVYTMGKSGDMGHVLLSEDEIASRGISFYHTNRGGDITFHGPGQVVGYPILDLERFRADLGWYLRSLEEVVIGALSDFGIEGGRSVGETGVWIDAGVPGMERKICAMGVRCSRWVTMHGFALNVNTDLAYFDHIVPCGIRGKQVASMERELGKPVSLFDVKESLKDSFEEVFGCRLVTAGSLE
jgi:lipoyl(octanoyl) transferase